MDANELKLTFVCIWKNLAIRYVSRHWGSKMIVNDDLEKSEVEEKVKGVE